MKLKTLLSAVALASAALAATSANAAFVNGSTSFTGGFIQPAAFTNLPNSIVSNLSAFSIDSAGFATGSTGDFWGSVSGPAVAFTCTTFQCTDGIGFTGLGTVTGNGYQATGFTMSWSGQGSCNESATTANACGEGGATASWSASISATGRDSNQVPEPGSLALIGLALAGIAVTSKAKKA